MQHFELLLFIIAFEIQAQCSLPPAEYYGSDAQIEQATWPRSLMSDRLFEQLI